MGLPKFYEILGVDQSADADAIKRAYRKLAVKHHPDKGGDEETFKKLTEAYEVLCDSEKKNMYDQLGDAGWERHSQGGGGGGHPDMSHAQDIFEQFFGGGGGGFPGFPGFHQRQPQRRQRRSHLHRLQISLEEAFNGITRNIKVTLNKTCQKCRKTCATCGGKGMVTHTINMGFMRQMISQPCGSCGGEGITKGGGGTSCGICAGKGETVTEEMLLLNVPAGVKNGDQYPFKGYGEQPVKPDEDAGDLIFEIVINPDAIFTREGNNLIYKHTLTFQESVVGAVITVPLFDAPLMLNTWERFGIIQPGERYRVAGRGICGADLIIIFSVSYPSISEDDRSRIADLFASLRM